MPARVTFSGAVEGMVDEAVLRRLTAHVDAVPGPIHGKNGKAQLRRFVNGYNNAARFSPWVVLVDLNREAQCAPELLASWLPRPAPWMSLRVVVRKVEAWLFGDRERLADLLGVKVARIPGQPEGLEDPKQTMVELVRQSRRRQIREDMAPRPASGRAVGPAYTSRLIEFVADAAIGWRPAVAAGPCPSLARCIRRFGRSKGTAGNETVRQCITSS